MQFTKHQVDKLSSFLIDLAKILFASSVFGFFIPGSSGQVNVIVFIVGAIFAFGCLIGGLNLLSRLNNSHQL